MQRDKIDALLREGRFDVLLKQLSEDDYEEYSFLALCWTCLLSGEEKRGKKLALKLRRLYPAGEFMADTEEILEAFQRGTVAEYVHRLRTRLLSPAAQSQPSAPPQLPPSAPPPCPPRNAPASLAALLGGNGERKKKTPSIPSTITAYFEHVYGLETIQAELDKFYKLLRFQNERKQSDFQPELIRCSHFLISGGRGSGKTLVSQIIASLLYDFGLRSNQQLVPLEAQQLLAAFQSDPINGVSAFLGSYSDVTIEVSNVQLWANEDACPSPTQFLAALEKALKEQKDRLSLIFTGSPEGVRGIQAQAPTLLNYIYTTMAIPAYSSDVLLEIAKKLAREKALLIHETAQRPLLKLIDLERGSSEFLNAYTLARYLDQAAVRLAERFAESDTDSEAAMVYLMPEDFAPDFAEENLEALLAKLDALTGLQSVKAQIKKRVESVLIAQRAEQAGAERRLGVGTLHMIFTGNPGTGKTTVARMIGRIYQHLGLLPRGDQMVECTRSDLVGQYQGHTAKLVQERVREAMGSVLFIDEAYSLCRGQNDAFGHEAVDELIAQMENNRDNLLVILAGYKKEMEEFLKSNPGFTSRIPYTIEFEDYTPGEMVQIFRGMVNGAGMRLEPGTDDALLQLIETRSKVPDFGNARGVRNLFDSTVEAVNERLLNVISQGMAVPREQYDCITKSDLEKISGQKAGTAKTLEALMAELNSLTGLSAAKAKVQELVDDLQVKAYMKQHGLSVDDSHGTLHLVFKGNAGTGKTTVARLMGQIYQKLGILSKNVFVETGRKDLVGQYQGHTAKNVIQKIEEAEGGILFIDEAYTLNGGEQDAFGQEAVSTLVAELENRRENLMVIVAGYGAEMDKFLDMNQGLASRLSNEIIFEDYTDEELLSIFRAMANKKGLRLEDGLDDLVLNTIRTQKAQVKDFGNARGVRNLLERAEKRKNSRVAALLRARGQVDPDTLCTFTREDFDGMFSAG